MRYQTYRVASVAVGGAINGVNPAPIGIHNDSSILVRATRRGAFLPGQRWMAFRLLCADLLGCSPCHQGREKECALIHICEIRTLGMNDCRLVLNFVFALLRTGLQLLNENKIKEVTSVFI